MRDAAIGRRRGLDGMLDRPSEAVADGLGDPAIEAKDEFVEVALQVLGPDRTMMGAEEPALGGGRRQGGRPAGAEMRRPRLG